MICREVSASDRRQSLISLTPKARALEKRYNEVSQQMNSLFFMDFEEAEIKELEQYLDRIVSNLERAEQALKKERMYTMAKIKTRIGNNYCPQALFLYGTKSAGYR